MMLIHHEKGIKMAQKELGKGKDLDMRAAAKKIVESQTKKSLSMISGLQSIRRNKRIKLLVL